MNDGAPGPRDHTHQYGRPWFWVLVAVAIAALFASGIAVIVHMWELLWACAALVVMAVAASKAVGVMEDVVVADPGPRARIAVTGRDSAPGPAGRLDRVPGTSVSELAR